MELCKTRIKKSSPDMLKFLYILADHDSVYETVLRFQMEERTETKTSTFQKDIVDHGAIPMQILNRDLVTRQK